WSRSGGGAGRGTRDGTRSPQERGLAGPDRRLLLPRWDGWWGVRDRHGRQPPRLRALPRDRPDRVLRRVPGRDSRAGSADRGPRPPDAVSPHADGGQAIRRHRHGRHHHRPVPPQALLADERGRVGVARVQPLRVPRGAGRFPRGPGRPEHADPPRRRGPHRRGNRAPGVLGAPVRGRDPEDGAGHNGAGRCPHAGARVHRQVRVHRRRSGDLSYAKLREEWRTLMTRRPTFREQLAPYLPLLDAWAQWPTERVSPLTWTAAECEERWRRGVPLLSEVLPSIHPQDIEDLLGSSLDFLAAVGEPEEELRRLAEAWDRGEIGPTAFLPAPG